MVRPARHSNHPVHEFEKVDKSYITQRHDLRKLVVEFLAEENPGSSPEHITESGTAYLLKINSKPAGFITYKTLSKGHYHISALGVTKSMRGHGYGRLLLELLMNKLDADTIRLGVNQHNTTAINLYKSLDFKIIESGNEEGMPFHLMEYTRGK